jgi:hypothetical protein
VIDVDLPTGPTDDRLVRGFAACLASVTETPVHELPQTDGDLVHGLGIWRNCLAEHDAGLVPIADPDRFQWAGWWIAITRNDRTRERSRSQYSRMAPHPACAQPTRPHLPPRREQIPRESSTHR